MGGDIVFISHMGKRLVKIHPLRHFFINQAGRADARQSPPGRLYALCVFQKLIERQLQPALAQAFIPDGIRKYRIVIDSFFLQQAA